MFVCPGYLCWEGKYISFEIGLWERMSLDCLCQTPLIQSLPCVLFFILNKINLAEILHLIWGFINSHLTPPKHQIWFSGLKPVALQPLHVFQQGSHRVHCLCIRSCL